jgi:peptide deformylase
MKELPKIILMGNPILRARARIVTLKQMRDPKIQEFIDQMIEVCTDTKVVGIAAPQLDRSLRIIIVASKPNERYPSAPTMEPTPIINPVVISFSREKESGWEGCMSMPGIRGLVPRHRTANIRYMDRSGQRLTGTFNGFIARILQHEIDHLNGLLFVDRRPFKLLPEAEYLQLMEKESGKQK